MKTYCPVHGLPVRIFIIALLLFSGTLLFGQALGDVNSSGAVDIVDALLVAQYYVGLNPSGFDLSVADVNCSSSVDIVDSLVIAQFYVGLIPELPCGNSTPDPTPSPYTGQTPVPSATPRIPYSVNENIRLNSIGYLPGSKKGASIAVNSSSFTVRRISDDSAAFSGNVSGQVNGVYQADFSALTEEGSFYLDVSGVGRSAPFEIKGGLYTFPFYTVMRGFYLWRSGTAVSGTHYGVTYSHAQSHMNDGYMDYITGSHTRVDGVGGWYDAGDYGKYVVNAGVTVGVMFMAWEHFQSKLENIVLDIPESGNSLPDYLDELKWEMDWILKMQYTDGTGRVSHKLTRTDFAGFVMPETDTADRFFVPWGSAATADFAAMAAMAYRIYQPYDPAYARRCLDAATVSYDFLRNNTAYHAADQSGFSTGGYEDSIYRDTDDRLWAAAEMWESTGNAAYLSDFESRAQSYSPKMYDDFDWGNVSNLGMITYLLSNRSGKNQSLVNDIRNSLISVSDDMVQIANTEAYRRPLGDSYYWGCNGGLARQTLILQVANMISPNQAYVDTALDAVNHVFGRNIYNRSYVTDLGYNPPMHPHDRRSGADGITPPWPGYLVGGGHSETGWSDIQDDYETNEIAINWSAALVYAIAGFLD
ncbi:MAG: glycoside hydrolase family 9 protein [Spirochaetales bacterium]|nr:glycoside hydrolase family 9 protein [Spirochaetales bacterium]